MPNQINQLPADSNNSKTFFTLSILTLIFFMWGLIVSLNEILIPLLKSVFDLNYTQAMLVQFCFFIAYLVVSIPAGRLIRKIGYKNGIVVGLVIASGGCLLFYLAADLKLYPIFLFALFVLASGITCLQVSANPYVTSLGNPDTSAKRLTLTQAFNSIGTTVGPLIGSVFILSTIHSSEVITTAKEVMNNSTQVSNVQMPYLILASTLICLALFFYFIKLKPINHSHIDLSKNERNHEQSWRIKDYPHTYLAAIGIFVYVGAEVAIGSFLVNFLSYPEIGNLELTMAAKYVSYYFGGAMIGRFLGAYLMHYIDASRLLTFNAVMAAILVITTIFSSGSIAVFAILTVGLFNSIMFPTIFSLGVKDLGVNTSNGSGLICLAIVGGAFIPMIQGVIADVAGIQVAFIVPVFCYFYIVFYGVKGAHIRK